MQMNMKCQILFSGKTKQKKKQKKNKKTRKNVSKCCLLKFLPNMLSIKILFADMALDI